MSSRCASSSSVESDHSLLPPRWRSRTPFGLHLAEARMSAPPSSADAPASSRRPQAESESPAAQSSPSVGEPQPWGSVRRDASRRRSAGRGPRPRRRSRAIEAPHRRAGPWKASKCAGCPITVNPASTAPARMPMRVAAAALKASRRGTPERAEYRASVTPTRTAARESPFTAEASASAKNPGRTGLHPIRPARAKSARAGFPTTAAMLRRPRGPKSRGGRTSRRADGQAAGRPRPAPRPGSLPTGLHGLSSPPGSLPRQLRAGTAPARAAPPAAGAPSATGIVRSRQGRGRAARRTRRLQARRPGDRRQGARAPRQPACLP